MFGLLTSIVFVSKLDAIGTLAIFRIIFSQNDRRLEKPTKNRKKTETFLEQRFLAKSMFYVYQRGIIVDIWTFPQNLHYKLLDVMQL